MGELIDKFFTHVLLVASNLQKRYETEDDEQEKLNNQVLLETIQEIGQDKTKTMILLYMINMACNTTKDIKEGIDKVWMDRKPPSQEESKVIFGGIVDSIQSVTKVLTMFAEDAEYFKDHGEEVVKLCGYLSHFSN